MRKAFIGFTLIFLLLLTAACARQVPESGGTQPPAGADSAADEETVVFISPDFGEKTLTVADIRSFPAVEKVLTRVDGDGNEEVYPLKGALLADILESMGKNQQALSGVRLVAGDGYMIEVPAEILAVRDVIFAYELDGKPLTEGVKPIRVFIPEERAMYWVRYLVRVELLGVREEQAVTALNILETTIAQLEHHDYTDDGSRDLAVAGSDLYPEATDDLKDTIYIKAADGLDKNEKTSVFQGGYVKFTGEGSPAFMAPDLPRGMHVRDILWMSRKGKGYLSVASGLGYFPVTAKNGRSGITLADVFEEVSFAQSDLYIFTAADGSSVEISGQDAARGLLYIGDDNEVMVYFAGLPENAAVRGLLSIKAVLPDE